MEIRTRPEAGALISLGDRLMVAEMLERKEISPKDAQAKLGCCKSYISQMMKPDNLAKLKRKMMKPDNLAKLKRKMIKPDKIAKLKRKGSTLESYILEMMKPDNLAKLKRKASLGLDLKLTKAKPEP
ncbi:hypothetical protein T484DRAFT_1828587 [Baffinella frigidus]|nr:hypothetical protein T484DRAFT_1828587 [Cryptophyta sp. CCMP2293]